MVSLKGIVDEKRSNEHSHKLLCYYCQFIVVHDVKDNSDKISDELFNDGDYNLIIVMLIHVICVGQCPYNDHTKI